MAVFEFEGKIPNISDLAYIHEQATVIGSVSIGEYCFVGAGAVIRGDYGKIEIGDRTSVQENVVIHARADEVCRIGNDVQIGHGSILHNCTVKDFAVIGLGSRICDYSVVGRWTIVGEGAVVTSNSEIPDEKVAVGMPARPIREVKPRDKEVWGFYKQKYAELAGRYKLGLRRIG